MKKGLHIALVEVLILSLSLFHCHPLPPSVFPFFFSLSSFPASVFFFFFVFFFVFFSFFFFFFFFLLKIHQCWNHALPSQRRGEGDVSGGCACRRNTPNCYITPCYDTLCPESNAVLLRCIEVLCCVRQSVFGRARIRLSVNQPPADVMR